MPKIAIATPCCFGGNASSRMDWLTGTRPPPASPCSTRKKIRLGQAPGRAAEEGAGREQHDGADLVVLAAEEPAQPAGHRDDDRVGDEVGVDRPGGLLDAGGERAADVVERDVDDRGVDDLDQRRQHHREGDEPLAPRDRHGNSLLATVILQGTLHPVPCRQWGTVPERLIKRVAGARRPTLRRVRRAGARRREPGGGQRSRWALFSGRHRRGSSGRRTCRRAGAPPPPGPGRGRS